MSVTVHKNKGAKIMPSPQQQAVKEELVKNKDDHDHHHLVNIERENDSNSQAT